MVRQFLWITTIQGSSMSPTLEAGDRLLLLRHFPARWLRKGQIVMVDLTRMPGHGPASPIFGAYVVKRVIGLPGERVQLDACELHEQARAQVEPSHEGNATLTWDIPREHFFVVGDSKHQSIDSSLWG